MRTIVLSYMVTNIVCVVFVALLWRQNRKRFAGTAFWVVDFIFQSVALFLIVMRGAIPDWISMVFSNTLVTVGAILGFMGLERFLGKKGSQIHNVLLVIIFIFVHGYFALVQPDLAARNLNLALALLLICFQSVWLVWRRVEPGLRSLAFGVGAVNSLYCLLSLVRIAHYFITPHADNNYFQPVLFEALVLVSYQVLFILLTYSFILMVNKRLLMQIGTQEEKFSKAFHSAPYAITLTRPSDGTIIDVNETFLSMTGYRRTEVIGKKTIDLQLWENDKDRAEVVDILSRIDRVHGMELPFRGKNGEKIMGLFSAEMITIDGEKSILSSIGDITDLKRADERMRTLMERLRLATRVARMGIWDWDPGKNVLVWDEQMYALYGVKKEDFSGAYEAWLNGLHPDDRAASDETSRRALNGEKEYDTEFRVILPGGGIRTLKAIASVIRDRQGNPLRMIGVNYDITEHKHAEEVIHASLLEKETMLKEIHHRVKNNLQVISSLLGLQSSYIRDEESREIFQESQNRVKVMAQIHTMLYQSADLARVDFGGFIRDLAGRLQQSYGIARSPIEIHTDITDVSLTIETSIPCGLILNELVANALKYAFPEGLEGRIDISMKGEESQCILKIRDNGIGFPESVDFHKTQSLGLELVNLLVGQLNGKIDIEVHGGTTWTITFPIKYEREWRNG
jgi:PAS domain S-box-containing protein